MKLAMQYIEHLQDEVLESTQIGIYTLVKERTTAKTVLGIWSPMQAIKQEMRPIRRNL